MTGEELQDLRGLVRASRAALGRLVGAHETTIWRWERGEGPTGLAAVALGALREGVRARGAGWGEEIVSAASADHRLALEMLFVSPTSASRGNGTAHQG